MQTKKENLKEMLGAGNFDKTLTFLYGKNKLNEALERYNRIAQGYTDTFGGQATGFFSAPGRTELGGNHTDHQHGCVLAASVDMDIVAAAAPNGENVIRIQSEGYEMDIINLDELDTPKPEEVNRSAALIRGIAARIQQTGRPVGGFNAYTHSNVPGGSGLSSSAAFEVLVAGVISELFCNGEIPPVVLAQIGQYAENVYFEKPSGLMDQTASAVGGVVAIDFKQPAYPIVESIPFDLTAQGYALCIIDSGAHHADLTHEYAGIPAEMKAVAEYFGKEVLADVSEDEFMAALKPVRNVAGDRAVMRAMHFFGDTVRAKNEASALRGGDLEWFFKLMNESGRSSLLYLQNVVPAGQTTQQELAFTLALCEKLLRGRGASRVHGGGFGGTAQAIVPIEMVDEFKTKMEAVLGEGQCNVVALRLVGFTKVQPDAEQEA